MKQGVDETNPAVAALELQKLRKREPRAEFAKQWDIIDAPANYKKKFILRARVWNRVNLTQFRPTVVKINAAFGAARYYLDLYVTIYA